jgi:hypothetical protein
MQHISKALQQTMSGKPNNGPSNSPSSLSTLQKSEASRFRELFPSDDSVIAYFSPSRWPEAAANPQKSVMLPSVTLAMVDQLYREGLAVTVVVNNIVGLFAVSRPREPLYREAIQQTARLFVGKYGSQLSMFAMLLFFADYLTDYKGSYGQFDLPDVLRQCGKSFLPTWRSRYDRQQRQRSPLDDIRAREVGKPALLSYLRRAYIDRGLDFHEAPVVKLGFLTPSEITMLENGDVLPF